MESSGREARGWLIKQMRAQHRAGECPISSSPAGRLSATSGVSRRRSVGAGSGEPKLLDDRKAIHDPAMSGDAASVEAVDGHSPDVDTMSRPRHRAESGSLRAAHAPRGGHAIGVRDDVAEVEVEVGNGRAI